MNEVRLQESVMRALPRLVLGMLYKLSIHVAKGPWDHLSLEQILSKLEEEYSELLEAIEERKPYSAILDEAADTANMLMILVDHVAHREVNGQYSLDFKNDLGA
jgi:hypothetical protein